MEGSHGNCIVIYWIDPPKVLFGLLDASAVIHKTQALITLAYPFRRVPNDLLDRVPPKVL